MEADIPKLELASLKTPDEAAARQRIYELTHDNGVELTPADSYHAEDSSGSIKLTVDRDAHLTHAHVDPQWEQRIHPGQFAAALFGTYLAALQRTALLEARRPRPAEQRPPAEPSRSDWSTLSLDEVLDHAKQELEEINAKITEIRQADAPAHEEPERRFTSPRRSLTMISRGSQPVGITGNTELLQRFSSYQISTEATDLFEIAGVGSAAGEEPAAQRRPANDPDAPDDDYFTDFTIDG
ncbi:hypothetical protein [Amycolatopsis sp. WGS_07]|uniref:hypothetical protein n=1 Tax=Amycolatopsis sp. WGS_07 TaxID=3076764 RepID=UPI00387363A5